MVLFLGEKEMVFKSFMEAFRVSNFSFNIQSDWMASVAIRASSGVISLYKNLIMSSVVMWFIILDLPVNKWWLTVSRDRI